MRKDEVLKRSVLLASWIALMVCYLLGIYSTGMKATQDFTCCTQHQASFFVIFLTSYSRQGKINYII